MTVVVALILITAWVVVITVALYSEIQFRFKEDVRTNQRCSEELEEIQERIDRLQKIIQTLPLNAMVPTSPPRADPPELPGDETPPPTFTPPSIRVPKPIHKDPEVVT